MLRFEPIYAIGSDLTMRHNVILDRDYTFGQIVHKILNEASLSKNKFGTISFRDHIFTYRFGDCAPIPEELANIPVRNVQTYGDWGYLDYYID